MFALRSREVRGTALNRLLRGVGCWMDDLPDTWRWPRFAGIGRGWQEAFLEVHSNALYRVAGGPTKRRIPRGNPIPRFDRGAKNWISDLPGDTPLLFVHVGRKDYSRCVRLLAALLGPGAELVHQPPDREPASMRRLPSVRLRPPSIAAQAHEAIRTGDAAAVRKLLRRGLRSNAKYSLDGFTAAHVAIMYDRAEILDLLLRSSKAPVRGDPLALAIRWRRGRMVEKLLEGGARPRPEHLTLAVTELPPEIVRHLLDSGARASPPLIRLAGRVEATGHDEADIAIRERNRRRVLRLLEAAVRREQSRRARRGTLRLPTKRVSV